MARGWPFVGGLLIVTAITYLNLNTINAAAKDIQVSLARERKKLEAARNAQSAAEEPKKRQKASDVFKWSTVTRVGDRIKKIWNEDIERSVRRMQNTDWERMGKALEVHLKRAQERMVTSFERLGEDSKKSSP